MKISPNLVNEKVIDAANKVWRGGLTSSNPGQMEKEMQCIIDEFIPNVRIRDMNTQEAQKLIRANAPEELGIKPSAISFDLGNYSDIYVNCSKIKDNSQSFIQDFTHELTHGAQTTLQDDGWHNIKQNVKGKDKNLFSNLAQVMLVMSSQDMAKSKFSKESFTGMLNKASDFFHTRCGVNPEKLKDIVCHILKHENQAYGNEIKFSELNYILANPIAKAHKSVLEKIVGFIE